MIALVLGSVVVIGRFRHGGASNAPAGFRSLAPVGARLTFAVPKHWQDVPAPNPGILVYHGHDAANGADLTVQAQDIGSMPVSEEAAEFKEFYGRFSTVTSSPDRSAGVPGFRVVSNIGGGTTTFVFKENATAYAFVYHLVSNADMVRILRTARSAKPAALDELRMQSVTVNGFTVQIPAQWSFGPLTNPQPGFDRILNRGGVEGGVIVNRMANSYQTVDQAISQSRQNAVAQGGTGVRETATTVGGQPAAELQFIAPRRDPRFITPSGLREVYVIARGPDLIFINLQGSDSATTAQLFDRIVSTVRFA